MAESPDDRVFIVHDVFKDLDVEVEVSRHEYESVWKNVGWKLQPTVNKKGN